MEIKKLNEIEEKVLEGEDAKNTKIQVLTTGNGNFIMRRFIIDEKGHTPLHQHPWEHEIFVIKGKGIIYDGKKEKELPPGTTLYIPPKEKHQFLNKSSDPFELTCVIPAQKSCLL